MKHPNVPNNRIGWYFSACYVGWCRRGSKWLQQTMICKARAIFPRRNQVGVSIQKWRHQYVLVCDVIHLLSENFGSVLLISITDALIGTSSRVNYPHRTIHYEPQVKHVFIARSFILLKKCPLLWLSSYVTYATLRYLRYFRFVTLLTLRYVTYVTYATLRYLR